MADTRPKTRASVEISLYHAIELVEEHDYEKAREVLAQADDWLAEEVDG